MDERIEAKVDYDALLLVDVASSLLSPKKVHIYDEPCNGPYRFYDG
jgi:hypothetical protein